MNQNPLPSYASILAKFTDRCTTSGLTIQVGERIAYYYQTRQVHKLIYVFPNQEMAPMRKTSHPVFRFVESTFDNWLAYHAKLDRDLWAMYNGPEAIYCKRGAVEGAIEEALQLAEETGRPLALHEADLQANWGY